MNRKRQRVLCLAISLLVGVTAFACTTAEDNGEPPSEPEEADILLEDDFEDPDSGWEEEEYGGGSVGYQDGAYSVVSVGEATVMWGVANVSYSDVDIEVDTHQISAPANDNNQYGIMCRAQDGSLDGYYFLISGDGYCAILKSVDEEFEALVDFASSSAVREGDAENHLRAVCDGSELELYVNGRRVASATDTTFTNGDIALTVASYEEEGTEVHFDNIVVREP